MKDKLLFALEPLSGSQDYSEDAWLVAGRQFEAGRSTMALVRVQGGEPTMCYPYASFYEHATTAFQGVLQRTGLSSDVVQRLALQENPVYDAYLWYWALSVEPRKMFDYGGYLLADQETCDDLDPLSMRGWNIADNVEAAIGAQVGDVVEVRGPLFWPDVKGQIKTLDELEAWEPPAAGTVIGIDPFGGCILDMDEPCRVPEDWESYYGTMSGRILYATFPIWNSFRVRHVPMSELFGVRGRVAEDPSPLPPALRPRGPRSIEEIVDTPPEELTDDEIRLLMEAWDLPTDPLPYYGSDATRPVPPALSWMRQSGKWKEFEELGYGPMTRERFHAIVREKRRTRTTTQAGRTREYRLREGYDYNPRRLDRARVEKFLLHWDTGDYDVERNEDFLRELLDRYPYVGPAYRGGEIDRPAPPVSWAKSRTALEYYFTHIWGRARGRRPLRMAAWRADVEAIDLEQLALDYLDEHPSSRQAFRAERLASFREVITLETPPMQRIGTLVQTRERVELSTRARIRRPKANPGRPYQGLGCVEEEDS